MYVWRTVDVCRAHDILRARLFAGAGMTDFPKIAVRSYDDLITAIVAVKNYLQLSDETVDTLAGLTRRHFDKIRSGSIAAGR